MYPLVAYTQLGASHKKRIIGLSAPFFLVALVNVGITLLIRTPFHTSYEGTTLSLEFWPWFTAFLKQVFAAVPLTHFFLFGRIFQRVIGVSMEINIENVAYKAIYVGM
jgi:hypothetical protein